MPTPKQTRFHYKRCRRRFYLLMNALYDAHNADVINYKRRDMKDGAPKLESVCDAIYEAKVLFEAATEEARADALRDECLKELKNAW